MNRLLVVCCLAAVAGCSHSPVDGVITAPLALPPGGSLDDLSIVLPSGRALAFVAQPMNGDETLKQDITLESDDEAIADVYPTTEMNQFVVVGVAGGTTHLRVRDDDGNLAPPLFEVEVSP